MGANVLPPGLEQALAGRGGRVGERWGEGRRSYLFAETPAGEVFARWSTDSSDVAVFTHEAAVRAALAGERGALRVPAVLALGDGWMLEQAVRPDGDARAAADAAVGAAARLAELTLPEPPATATRRRGRLAYRLRLLRRPRLLPELARVRELVRSSTLPPVAAHGDFYPGNVLASGGVAWVVDWELCGRLPLGYDLAHYWATADDEEARAVVHEGALELVGPAHRVDLLRLRYAVAVRIAASKLAAAAPGDRDPAGAERLLRRLPELREGF